MYVKETCVGLCSHNNDQTVLLNMEKGLAVNSIFIENLQYFCFLLQPPAWIFILIFLFNRKINLVSPWTK